MLSSLLQLLPMPWSLKAPASPKSSLRCRSNSPVSRRITLPDTLSCWPWRRRLNPHYEEVKQASAAWVASFGAFSPRAQCAFDRCDFGLLASLAYPLLSKEHLRTGCDLMNLFFVIDEHTDVANQADSQRMVNTIMDALRHPHRPRPEREWVGGEIARQFWLLAAQSMGPLPQRRFLATFDHYLHAVVTQAQDRCDYRIRDIQGYLDLRRDTIGAKPSFAIMEAGLDLSDEVMQHPALVELSNLAIDLLCIGNDLVSYNKEQACGDDQHNLVTIVMHERDTGVQGAMDWVADLHAELEGRFRQVYSTLPRWGGAVDMDVQEYAFGLGNWVRANDQWSFESQRYFGNRGLEILQTRTLQLLPRVEPVEVGPHVVDESQL